uniref:Uncharacterized protein n=1 Tax=Arundo donax TaxID=35708 RepID=A0A0A9G4G1_ARUDO
MARVLLAVLLQPKYYNWIWVVLIMIQEPKLTWLTVLLLKCPTCTTNINFNPSSFLKWSHQILEPCALLAHGILIPNICSTVW